MNNKDYIFSAKINGNEFHLSMNIRNEDMSPIYLQVMFVPKLRFFARFKEAILSFLGMPFIYNLNMNREEALNLKKALRKIK